MPVVRYSYSLDAIQDADLIRRLETEINASAVVRDALRAWYERPTAADLDAKLDRLLAAMRDVRVIQATAPDDGNPVGEPAAARAGLDGMKQRFRGK